MDSKAPMEVAALGQPFGLGMLYDCRRDSVISGMTLWDCNNLIEHTRERPKHYSDFDVVASDSLEAKSSALNVKASLKASFFSGLVEVEGSAKYLTDQKTSKNQARVTLMYKTTTKFQELSMNHLGKGNIQHQDVFEKGIATHIVTGILYGANAFFVFDREMTENEDHRDIQGNMKVMIKKIPSTTIEGDGSLKMEDKDKKTVQQFSCKFYGDFLLEKNPVTFQDAVEVYQRLPKLLGAKGENAVPVKVWLLPLTVIDSKAAELVREISAGLVQKAQNVLEDMSEPEIRCNDAMKTTIAQQFPQIGVKLKCFKEICSMFKLEFQQTLAKKLPSIRGGGEEEEELAKILKNRYSTCFNSKDLRVWMDHKEREIYILEFFTSMMKNTKVIPSENHLYKEIIRTKYTVCFVFTSLGSAEPYLSALSSYLGGTTNPDASQDPCEQWYTLKEVTEEIRKQAKLFSDFAEANKDNENTKFLVVGFTDEAKRGSAIYLYNGVFTVSKNFEPPSKPEAVIVSELKHNNSVTLKISPPRYGAENITSYLAEFCVCGEDEWKQQTVPTTDADEVTVNELSPNTGYKFRCRAVTSAGVSPVSDIITLPASSLGFSIVSVATMEVAALGRPFGLGMVYDSRRDLLVPGLRLWRTEDIERKTHIIPQPSTSFKVAPSETLSAKMSLLGMSASEKLSFYGGLMKAEGSAKYLNEKTSSTLQCKVTLHYHKTTEITELLISALGGLDPEILSNTDGTHVVVRVLYGADAFVEFQGTCSDASCKQEIQAKLNVMMTKIPSVEIRGGAHLNMNDEDKEMVKNFSCKTFIDFNQQELPTTSVCHNVLPSPQGQSEEKLVPVKVWLYPLSKLCNTAPKLKRMISETLVLAVEKVMDDFHSAEIKTNDLLERSKEIKAEDIINKLEKFQSSLRVFTSEFLRKMSDLIPAIRGGDIEESALTDFLKSLDASGFSEQEMEQWLDGKETEINVITINIKKLRCDIKSPGHELDSFLLSPDVTDVFVFSFTSLRYEEPYLDKVSQTAKSFRSGSTISTPEQNLREEVPWYRRPEVKKALHSCYSLSTLMISLHKKQVISFISDPEYPGAAVRWYQSAVLKDQNVSVIQLYRQQYACNLTLDPDTASRRVRLSEGNRKVTGVEELQPYPDHPDRFDDFTGQVLSREPLIGRCYWEWEWSGYVAVGVAYKSMSRTRLIGHTDKSWGLWCYDDDYTAYHNDYGTRLPAYLPSDSRRAGVCVDYKARTVSFYNVSSDTHTHLHTFNITHTNEILYAAFYVYDESSLSLV